MNEICTFIAKWDSLENSILMTDALAFDCHIRIWTSLTVKCATYLDYSHMENHRKGQKSPFLPF